MYMDFPKYSYRPEREKTEAQITRLSLLELIDECAHLLLVAMVFLGFSCTSSFLTSFWILLLRHKRTVAWVNVTLEFVSASKITITLTIYIKTDDIVNKFCSNYRKIGIIERFELEKDSN